MSRTDAPCWWLMARRLLLIAALLFILLPQPLLAQSSAAPIIQPGDQLYLSLPGEASFNRTFGVDRQGRLLLPEIGEVKVAQLSLDELRKELKRRLGRVFRDLSRFDLILKERRLLLSVLGYVKQPGPIELAAGAGVESALHAAGGLIAGAQLDRLQLRRGGSITTFDYKGYLDSGDTQLIPTLRSLDELFVPASPLIGNVQVTFDPSTLAAKGDAAEDRTAVKVFGEVFRPGSFAYRPGSTLVDWLMRAGGITRFAGVEQIRVISGGRPTLFNLTAYLDSGDSTLLPTITPGTTLFVPMATEEVKAGGQTVYVMGEVFRPGAYDSKPGAGFLDILANAGGPTRFAEVRQIRVLKGGGGIAPFDLQAYTENPDPALLPPVVPGDALFVPEKAATDENSWLRIPPSRAVQVIGAIYRPGRYEWSDEMSLLDLLAHAGGPTARADLSALQLIDSSGDEARTRQFDLGTFLEQGGSLDAIPQPKGGDTVVVPELPVDPNDNKSLWVRQAPENSIYIFGEVRSPGRYAFNRSLGFLDILAAAEGPTDAADLHHVRVVHRNEPGARVSRLDLALYFQSGDESLLPRVLPGDAIYFPGRGRQWLEIAKEETVRILGAVARPGRYRFDERMTILDLLAEAGGPSSSAYLERIVVVNTSCCADRATSFDLPGFARSGDFSRLPLVRAGDTIYVPDLEQSDWRIFMSGVRDTLSITSLLAILSGGI